MYKIFGKVFDFLILPYWMLIEIIYGLRIGILLTLFLAVVLNFIYSEYNLIFGVLLTVILGGIITIFGGSYYYLKTKSIILENEINILEDEVELMPDIKAFGIQDDVEISEEDISKTDYSFILSLLRAIAFLIGSIPIFSPYLFNVSKPMILKIIIIFSFVFLCIIGIVEGKIRGENSIKNIFKETLLGIFLVAIAYLWGTYFISIIKP